MTHTQFYGAELTQHQVWKEPIPDTSGKIIFSQSELQEPEMKDIRVNLRFARALAGLRMSFRKPMNVTSCCRSKEHNEKIGGHPRSLHVYRDSHHGIKGCAAADISIFEWPIADILKLTYMAGHDFKLSIGLNWEKHFAHLDMRCIAMLDNKLFIY